MKKIITKIVIAAGLMVGGAAVGQTGQLAPGVDLNADGKAELLQASSAANQVKVLDGATHATLVTINGPVANSGFGAGIAWIGDVNGDGLSDLAVIAPGTAQGTGSSASTGTVYIYSLVSGALIASSDAPAGRALGGVVKIVPDQDSDSVADVVVDLQWTGTQTKSMLISGKTGQVLVELPGTAAEMVRYVGQGGRLYARADFDGSGTVDLLDVAGFTTLVTNGDMRADLNHDGVIDGADSLLMMDEAGEGIVTIAAQQWSAPPSPPDGGCQCPITPNSGNGNTGGCSGVTFDVLYPGHVEVGAPAQFSFTGNPSGGTYCAEIVQGEGQILGSSTNPLTVVPLSPAGLCLKVKYTVNVGGTECSTCQSICLGAELFCPTYGISLHCPTLADECPALVSANAINTVFALVTPEGYSVHWEITDPGHLVEWSHEYSTQLRFRAKNQAGSFTVHARYGPESGPCTAAHAECVINIDPDSDGDGLSDSWETAHCTDPQNPDTDGDLVWDGVEIAMGTDPCDNASTPAMIDSDADGLTDIEELQVYHTDPHNFDTDGDGISDYAEVELARLGVLLLNPLNAYSLAEANTSLEHAFDGWQPVYYTAWDKDRDGLFDPWELATGLDPTQADQDQDGISDGLEMRPRVTGVHPMTHAITYAPTRSPMFAEDGPRGGNVFVDSDHDGLMDDQEIWLGTDPANFDTDGDGLSDGAEVALGYDPLRTNSSGGTLDGLADYDGDGLSNSDEEFYGCDLRNVDSDGDGTSDGAEIAQGSFPFDSSDQGQPVGPGGFAEVTLRAGWYKSCMSEWPFTCKYDTYSSTFGSLRLQHPPVDQYPYVRSRTARVPTGKVYPVSTQVSMGWGGSPTAYPVGIIAISGPNVIDNPYENFGEAYVQKVAIFDLHALPQSVLAMPSYGQVSIPWSEVSKWIDANGDRTLVDRARVQGVYADGLASVGVLTYPWPRPLAHGISTYPRFIYAVWGRNNQSAGSFHSISAWNPNDPNYVPDYGNLAPDDVITFPLGLNDINATDRGYCNLCVWHAPDGFPSSMASSTAETIDFKIYDTNSYAAQTTIMGSLKVRRPPVVLVHGFKAGPEDWKKLWTEEALQSVVRKVDYSDCSWAGMDPDFGLRRLEETVANTLRDARLGIASHEQPNLKWAAMRVDVVGHSMGGLLTRYWIAHLSGSFYAADRVPSGSTVLTWPRFERPDQGIFEYRNTETNWYCGSIRRLITIGTPHQGSPVANDIYRKLCDGGLNINALEAIKAAPGGHAYAMYEGDKWVPKRNTVVLDLQAREVINSVALGPSVAIQSMNNASYYSPFCPEEYGLPVWRAIAVRGGEIHTRYLLGATFGVGLLWGENDDYVVPIDSQLCSPEPSNIAPLPLLPAGLTRFVANHGEETESPEIFSSVKEMLHGPRFVGSQPRFREGEIK